MAESKRATERSKHTSIRSNPPPPPPRRPNSAGGGKDKSMREKNVQAAGQRPRSTASRSRSKSRPRESRSRSKSRPREAARDKESRSHSKSRPQPQSNSSHRQSKKSATKTGCQNGNSRTAPKKQPSAKKREKYAANAQKAIPALICMISGSHDISSSEDVSNIISSQYQLPNPTGRSSGACTAAFLQVMYQSHERGKGDDVTWVDVLQQMRDILDEKRFDHIIPQLTSSRMIDVHDAFAVTPTDGSFSHKKNTKRALLIGINYFGKSGQLNGGHNDVRNMAKYLTEMQNFRKENITMLMDDGVHKAPTKKDILSAFRRLVKESKEGDVAFCHYSGHGGRLSRDDKDGYDETLIPVDFEKAGQIRDRDVLKALIHPMPAGVTMTCLIDCCHGGTVLDLPYRCNDELENMGMNDKCNFKDSLWVGMALQKGGNDAASTSQKVAPEFMILGGGPNAVHEYSDSACCVVL